jgi:hypothetical protein
MSFPRDAWLVRMGLALQNLLLSLRRTGFRAYLHPPQTLLATAGALGFTPALQHRGWIWEAVVLERGRGGQ